MIWHAEPDGTIIDDEFAEATAWALTKFAIHFEADSFGEAKAHAYAHFGLVDDEDDDDPA